ncbi:MAG: hypothetical protein C0593_05370, partial [Marinilabiliales bacterium]
VHPANTSVVIAGTADGKVQVSTNGGMSWDDKTGGLPGRWVTKVIGDPFDENKIYVTMSGLRWSDYLSHVYMSEDLGDTWIDISSNLPELPANSILADPDHEGSLFIGIDAGVYHTRNYGESWEGINNGIPKPPVVDLRLQENTRQLYMGGYGTSIYRLALNDLYVGMESHVRATANMTPYPNPVANGSAMTIPVTVTDAAYAEVYITDMTGRRVAEVFSGSLASGTSNLEWTPTNLAKGFYLCTMEWNGQMVTEKIAVQ